MRSSGAAVGVRAQPHGQELPRLGGRGGLPVGRRQSHRDHVLALAVERHDPEIPQSLPGQLRGRAACRLIEQVAERALPAGAQGRDPQRPFQVPARLVRQVQQAVDLRDRHRLGAPLGPLDRVARLDLALLDDPEVEAGAMVRDQQRRHLRLVHPEAEPVAGDPRLADLEQRRADAVAVPDADLVVGQAFDREVLAELAVREVVAFEELRPVAVGFDLVDVHGAVDAAVPLQVALPVAVDVEAADHLRPVNRAFPDAGVDGPAFPLDVLRQADVDRQQPTHGGGRCHGLFGAPRPPVPA